MAMRLVFTFLFFFGLCLPLQADETCMSPYMAKIVGQEDYVYIWTLGMEGVGDGEDKLVTGREPLTERWLQRPRSGGWDELEALPYQ